MRVVVVGGGVTGLTVAHRLSKVRNPGGGGVREITVLERGSRFGGKIVTDRVDEFLVEGGADSMLARKQAGPALCDELGIGDQLVPTVAANRRAFVWRHGILHPLPEGMTGLVPGRLTPLFLTRLLSPRGRLRAAAELFVRPSRYGAEETVAAFARRRFGNEVYERLLEPLLCGIYAGDGARLSVDATVPSLPALERQYGSVLRGVRRVDDRDGHGRTGFVSLRDGMGELVQALVRRSAGVAMRARAGVAEIVRDGAGVAVRLEDGGVVRADIAVVTVPANVAATMLAPFDAAVAGLAGEISFASTATVSLGFRRSAVRHDLRGYGYVVPRDQGRDALACSWSSSKLEGRAPDGTVLVRTYFGRDGEDVDGVADDALIAMATRELGQSLGARAEPIFSRVYRFPKSMPQYTLGHMDRVARLDKLLASRRQVVLTGCSYRGVGIPDCIEAAERAAQSVWEYGRERGAA